MSTEYGGRSAEYGARAELARGLVGWSMEYRGKDPKGAKVQSGAELARRVRRCKSERSSGGKVERWDQRTEYGEVALTVQKCKSADGLCKGAKVKSEDRVRSTERGRSPREAESANGVRHVQDAERSQTPWRARLARSANPTSIQDNPTSIHSEEGGSGDRDICKRPESSLNYLSAKH